MNSVHCLLSILTTTSLVRVMLKFSKMILFSALCVSPDTLKFRSDIVCTYMHSYNYYEAQFVNHVLQLTKRVSALSSTVGDTSCQVYAIIEMMVNTGSTCSAKLMTYQA